MQIYAYNQICVGMNTKRGCDPECQFQTKCFEHKCVNVSDIRSTVRTWFTWFLVLSDVASPSIHRHESFCHLFHSVLSQNKSGKWSHSQLRIQLKKAVPYNTIFFPVIFFIYTSVAKAKCYSASQCEREWDRKMSYILVKLQNALFGSCIERRLNVQTPTWYTQIESYNSFWFSVVFFFVCFFSQKLADESYVVCVCLRANC